MHLLCLLRHHRWESTTFTYLAVWRGLVRERICGRCGKRVVNHLRRAAR